MMPGVTNLPVASIILAFGSRGFRFGPISAIFPFRIRIDPLLIVPCEAVMMVDFFFRVSPGAIVPIAELAPVASFGLLPVCANTEATIANISNEAIQAFVFLIISPIPIADRGSRIADWLLS